MGLGRRSREVALCGLTPVVFVCLLVALSCVQTRAQTQPQPVPHWNCGGNGRTRTALSIVFPTSVFAQEASNICMSAGKSIPASNMTTEELQCLSNYLDHIYAPSMGQTWVKNESSGFDCYPNPLGQPCPAKLKFVCWETATDDGSQRTCPLIDAPRNSFVEYPTGRELRSYALSRCLPDFTFASTQNTQYQCINMSSGENPSTVFAWHPAPEPPACVRLLRCPLPLVIPNATVLALPGSATPGYTAIVVCSPGFARSGARTLTCSGQGTWPTPLTTCTKVPSPVQCPSIPAIRNGYVQGNINGPIAANTRWSVFCESEFTLSGNSTLHCDQRGVWQLPYPQCMEKVVSSFDLVEWLKNETSLVAVIIIIILVLLCFVVTTGMVLVWKKRRGEFDLRKPFHDTGSVHDTNATGESSRLTSTKATPPPTPSGGSGMWRPNGDSSMREPRGSNTSLLQSKSTRRPNVAGRPSIGNASIISNGAARPSVMSETMLTPSPASVGPAFHEPGGSVSPLLQQQQEPQQQPQLNERIQTHSFGVPYAQQQQEAAKADIPSSMRRRSGPVDHAHLCSTTSAGAEPDPFFTSKHRRAKSNPNMAHMYPRRNITNNLPQEPVSSANTSEDTDQTYDVYSISNLLSPNPSMTNMECVTPPSTQVAPPTGGPRRNTNASQHSRASRTTSTSSGDQSVYDFYGGGESFQSSSVLCKDT
ncbi:uncharacterized protein LOC135819627 [Sycon ciliatum]|uniref:uncharacterized protein LOC135819627 n=1 Tax=Sycon ciliatum TaxID=27933 RepID=UPI0031F65C23